jgi:hypothetical protein
MAKYTVEIRDQYGRFVTEILRPQNKTFSVFRDKPGSCRFTMDLLDPQCNLNNLKINQYDVVFRRYGTALVGGQISYLNPVIDGDRKTLEITATGWPDLLDYRFIYAGFPNFDVVQQQLAFPPTDSSLLVWSLVRDTQFPISYDGSQAMTGVTPTINQSFQCQGTAGVTAIKLMVQQVGTPTGNLVVGIYTDYNNSPISLVADSQITIPVSSLPGPADTELWYEIDYSDPLPQLVNGRTYWIKCYLDTGQTVGNSVIWYWLDGDIYSRGRAYSPESPALFPVDVDLQFFIIEDDNSYQMTKNTYLGFVQGNLPVSFDVSPTYAVNKKVKQCIEDIANTQNGIDFSIYPYIDPVTNYMTKVFTTYYPRQGIDNTSLNFQYPGNIKRFNKPKDAKTLENEIQVRGNGTGSAQLTDTEFDAESIWTYGQKQDIEDVPDIGDFGTLQKLALEYIRVRKDPLDVPEILLDGNLPPTIGSYWVGDEIQFTITGVPAVDSSESYRIEEIDVTINDDDQEEIGISTSKA